MELITIIALVLLGLFLIVAEILLLPGITIAAVGSIISFLTSLYFAYIYFDVFGASITLLISLLLVTVALIICMKRKNLKIISLETKISSQSSVSAKEFVKIGDKGYAKTRLAPIGSVVVGDHVIDAKSFEGYITQKHPIEVVGFEDSVVVVKKINAV